jgi:hypothetical protein
MLCNFLCHLLCIVLLVHAWALYDCVFCLIDGLDWMDGIPVSCWMPMLHYNCVLIGVC